MDERQRAGGFTYKNLITSLVSDICNDGRMRRESARTRSAWSATANAETPAFGSSKHLEDNRPQ